MEIIYSDKDLIVINKPAGISVHGGDRVTGRTVADWLLEKFPEISGVGDDPKTRPGMVHRLDKDTSGVMVVARNQKSFEYLKGLFQARLVEKIYWAVVCGRLKKREGVISFPIGRLVKNPLKRGIEPGPREGIQKTVRGAREAITEYGVLKSGENFSLVELRPKTGRMHQLRVHLKALGNPVACDKLYGGKNVCCPEGANRQLLHAKSVSFSFPAFASPSHKATELQSEAAAGRPEGRRLNFEADPPEDFISI